MIGQGSPLGDCGANRYRVHRCAALALSFLCVLLFATSGAAQNKRRAAAPPLELRLRVKWGYEKPRAWQGIIEVSQGEILELRHLGSSADGAASYRLRDGRIEVDELTPRTQSEIEIVVQSARDAELVVHLEENAAGALRRQAAIPLANLIAKPAQLSAAEDAPWLNASRAPGDELRIQFEGGRRIYSVGETATVTIEPHEILGDPSSVTLPLQLRADLRLVSLKTREEVWYERRELESDAMGVLPSLPSISVFLPREEGAYEFVVKLENRRFLSNGFAPVERRQSLIVLADNAPGRSDAAWRSLVEIDPTVRSWWDSLRVLPSIKGIPGLNAPAAPVASAKTGIVSRGGRKWAALPPGSWQAIPLTTAAVGEPHIVQIELPQETSTTPRILLLEQRASGQVATIGLDASGIISRDASTEKNKVQPPETCVQSLVYWPTTSTVWLVVASREDSDRESYFGKVQQFAGPSVLPPLATANRSDRGRILAMELRSDRWREQFGADDSASAGATEANYQASVRLASYLKAKGYNCARLLVASGGKALFPSEYFDGPVEQSAELDRVELLLRVLARDRLLFIPEIAFNAPLSPLETLRDSADQIVPGADMIMKSGAAVRLAGLDASGVGPLYNPLDSEVQSAMRSALEDFLDRYAHLESFGGLAMRLTPDCFSRLPSEEWGKDSPTLDRFAQNVERVRQEPKSRPNQRASFVEANKREAWLTWRAQELGGFYDWVQSRVAESRPEAKLYLPLNGLLEGQASEQKIRDVLFGASGASLRDLWLAAGIDPQSWKSLGDMVFLRPTHFESDNSPVSKLYFAAENSDEWRQFMEAFRITGASASPQDLQVTLSGFAQRGPFRKLDSESFVIPLPRSFANANPLVEAVLASDPFAFSVTDVSALAHADSPGADWIEIFRRLPPDMMKSVAPRAASSGNSTAPPSTPVVIRQATSASRTWFYAVNPCPFPVTITVDIQAPPGAKLEALGGKKLPPTHPIGQILSWSYTLAPREMVGAAISSPKSKLLSYSTSVDHKIVVELRQELAALRSRLLLANQSAHRPYDVLKNPQFDGEAGAAFEGDFGWEIVSGDPASATIVPDNSDGTCVKMMSRGDVVSLRSQVIPYPQSQRLVFSIDLRTDSNGDKPPEVKVIIEGEINGQPFIKRATVNRTKTLNRSWQNLRFPIDYLPEVKNLRVGVDLCSAGSLYVDRAALGDFWYSKDESQPVLKELAIANHELEENRVTAAQRLMSGYLPNYLREQLAQPETRSPQQIAMPPANGKSTGNTDRSLQDRVNDLLPLPKNLIQRR